MDMGKFDLLRYNIYGHCDNAYIFRYRRILK